MNNANKEFFSDKNNNIHSNTPYQNTDGTPQAYHIQTHTINRKNNRNTLFNNNNNNELDSILRRPKKTNTGVHPYILNNQKKRKQKRNQNNANRLFFSNKQNNIHSNTPYQNTNGTPQGHHLQTHTINRKNNRNTLFNNNINNNLQNRLRSQGRRHNQKFNNNLANFGVPNMPLSDNETNRIKSFIERSRGPSQKEIEGDFVYSPYQQRRRYEVPFEVNNLNRQPKRRSNRKTKKRRPRKKRGSIYNNNVSNYVVLNSNKVKRAKRWNSLKNTGRKISNKTKHGYRSLKISSKKLTNRIKRSFRKSNTKKMNKIRELENKIERYNDALVYAVARGDNFIVDNQGKRVSILQGNIILERLKQTLDEL